MGGIPVQATRDDLRRALTLAIHEMGHYVVARALGFRTGGVWINVLPAGGNGVSAIRPEPLCSLSEVQAYMERRLLVLFSGTIAEALEFHLPQPLVDQQKAMDLLEERDLNGDSDHAKVNEILLFLINMSKASAEVSDDKLVQAKANKLYHDLFGRAVELVESNVASIRHFAKVLAKRVAVVPIKVSLDAEELENSPEIKSIQAATIWNPSEEHAS